MPPRCRGPRSWETFRGCCLIPEPRQEGREELVWGRRVGRDYGAEQREVERGGGGLHSNHRFREVAGPFLPVPLREDFFFFKYIYKGTVHTPRLAGYVVTALSWGPLEVRAVGGRLVATCAVGKATGTGGTFSGPSREGKEASQEGVGTQPCPPPGFHQTPPAAPPSRLQHRDTKVSGTFLSIFFSPGP